MPWMATVFLSLAFCAAMIYLVGFFRAFASLTPVERERVRSLGSARRNLAIVVPVFLATTVSGSSEVRFACAMVLFLFVVVGSTIERRRLETAQLPRQFIQRRRHLSVVGSVAALLLATGLGVPLVQ
jgi:hypothetical protein